MTRYYDETLGAVADQSRDVIREQTVGEELDDVTIPAKVVYEMWDDAARKLIDIYPVVELDRLIDWNYTAEKLVKSIDGLSYEMQATATKRPADERMMIKLGTLRGVCNKKIQLLGAGYPQEVIKTFDQQEREAREWLADNTTPTWMIDRLIIQRGEEDKAAFCAYIGAKAKAFAEACGDICGTFAALEKRLEAGEEPDDVNWQEEAV